MATFNRELSKPTPVQISATPGVLNEVVDTAASTLEAGTRGAQFGQLEALDTTGAALKEIQDQAQTGAAVQRSLELELIDPNSKRTVDAVFSDLTKLQQGQMQGAISPNEAKTRASTIFRKAVAATPGLAPEFQRAYQALGFSASQGAGGSFDPVQALVKQKVQDIADATTQGFDSVERFYTHNRILNNAQEAAANLQMQQNVGELAFPDAVVETNKIVQASTMDLSQRFLAAAKIDGRNVDVNSFLTEAAVEQQSAHAIVDQFVAANRRKGILYTQDQVNKLHTNVDNAYKTFNTILSTNDPAAVAKKLNERTKEFAQEDVNQFYAGFGPLGASMQIASPDTQATQMAAVLEYKNRIDNDPSVKRTLEGLSQGDPTNSIAQTLSLLNAATPDAFNKFISAHLSNPDTVGGDDPHNSLLTTMAEIVRDRMITEGMSLEDPAALDNFNRALKSKWTSSNTTTSLNRPQIISQAKRNSEVKEQIHAALTDRTAMIISDIQSGPFLAAPNSTGFQFTYDPARTTDIQHGSWGMITSETIPTPFTATDVRHGGTRFNVAQRVPVYTDLIKQLNDIYRYKFNVEGPNEAQRWAEGVNSRFNRELPDNLDVTEDGEVFSIE